MRLHKQDQAGHLPQLLGLSILGILTLSGCGYSSVNSELTGQAKRVVNQHPIFCADRVDADLSLGVMRNGVGSMSTEDVWVTVPNASDQEILRKAAEKGSLVKIIFDEARLNWCWQDKVVNHVEITQ